MTTRAGEAPASQTLSRGIRILEILSAAEGSLSIDEISRLLGVHRSIAYRLLRTLEDHGLVLRDSSGRIALGARMAALAFGVARDLQSAALPELTAVANALDMTCFLAVLDREECITLASIEPRRGVASVVQRPGAHHSLTVGAPSKAILSALDPADWPVPADERLRAEVAEAASRGYATSHDEVIPTVQSFAVPLRLRAPQRPAAIAVLHVGGGADVPGVSARLESAAASIRAALEG